jgi:ADP-ribosyl-[dinitrogen reductase] hydrolase
LPDSEIIRSRARGVCIGSGIGDALGASLEFMSREDIQKAHGGPLREIIGGGVWQVRPGQITDDTEMALGLARSLHLCGRYHPNAALQQYLQWFEGDPVDVGSTVAYILNKARHGYPAEWAAEEFHHLSGGKSAGNGALMRQAPLAMHYHDDLPALEKAVRQDCALTHYDPLAAECSVYFTRQLARLIQDPSAQLEMPEDPQLRAAVTASREDIMDRVDSQMGFCLTALAVAVHATRYSKDYEQGLTWAVNLGGDADTNGAVAGALLGAKFGVDSIPARWIDKLEATQELEQLTEWSLSGKEGYGEDPFFAQPPPRQSEAAIQIPSITNVWEMSIEELEDAFGVARDTFSVLSEEDQEQLREWVQENPS